MISEQLPSKAGAKLVLNHGTSALVLNQTLQEQGIVSETATLSCTYMPNNLYLAWCYVQGLATSEDEYELEGVTCLKVTAPGQYLHYLPESLQNLTLDFKLPKSGE